MAFYRLVAAAGPPEALPMIVRCYSAVADERSAASYDAAARRPAASPLLGELCRVQEHSLERGRGGAGYGAAGSAPGRRGARPGALPPWGSGVVGAIPSPVTPGPAPESGRGAVVAPAR